MVRKMGKRDKWVMAVGLLLLVCAGILQGFARNTAWFGSWYVGSIYPLLSGSIGRLFGLFPFSVVEFGLYALILAVLIYGVVHIRKPFQILSRAFLVISILLFVYTCNCGINYYAKSFSAISDIPVQKSSADELYELCLYLMEEIEANQTTASYRDDPAAWKREGVASMKALGETYPALKGYYPMPKEVMVSRILSVQQLSGIYAPFTIEANYNGEIPDYNIPFTICHELSHLRGFMREDEANFIGYLACTGSENQAFRYSGYLLGWIHASNALARVDLERYMDLYAAVGEQMRSDLAENSAFWRQYDGVVAEISNQMNDTYLKMNSQHDGVQSYGRMVDLMLSYYRQR